jgi:NADPH2:quinone reductase
VSETTITQWQSDKPGRDAIALIQADRPEPGPGELLVAVKAAALNFSDLLMLEDKYQVRPPRPFTPGQEVAGEVIATGEGTGFRTGDRVAAKVDWGGFAEQVIVRADMALRLPADIDFVTGAAIPVSYTTAMVALTECTKLKPGEYVVIHAAAGGVGLAAVQLAKSMGAVVIGTAGSAEKRDLVREHGADYCLDYRDEGWLDELFAITGPDRAQVVLDPVGGETTLQSLRALGLDGRLLIVGFASGTIPQVPAHRLLLRRIAVIGVYWNHDKDAAMLRRVAQRITDALEAGMINPVVETRPGLNALPAALDDLANRRTRGKLVLDLTSAEAVND